MKKIILLQTLIFLIFFALSSFKNSSLKLRSDTFLHGKVFQQERTVTAYIMSGGNWQKGQVTYIETNRGYQPVSYDFSDYVNGPRGRFYSDQRFRPLNPNNPLAKANNWTHTIEIRGTVAYLSIY